MRDRLITIALATFVAVVLTNVQLIPRAWAAFTASPTPWSATFEANPVGTDSPALLDDIDRQVKVEVRSRVETEHDFGTQAVSGDTNDDGRHREGSARAFVQSTEPPVDGTTAAICLPTADDDGDRHCDEGRIWMDSDDNALYVAEDTGADGDADVWTRTGFPTGGIILWTDSETCPTGFTEQTAFRGLLVRGTDIGASTANVPDTSGVSCSGAGLGSGCDATGGTDNYDDDLSTDEQPAHTHTHEADQGRYAGGAGGEPFTKSFDNGGTPAGQGASSIAAIASNSTGGGEDHLHPFVTALFCKRD